MLNYLIDLHDTSGEFTYKTSVGLVDDKSWDSWNWPQGVALYGLAKMYQKNQDPELLEIIQTWFTKNLHYPIPERELNVNGVIPILTLATLKDELVLKNIDTENYLLEWAEWVLKDLNKTPFGGFEHDTFGSINRHQLWDDTLVMAVLPLAKIGIVLNRSEYVAASMNQFVVHSKFLMERENGLWYHGWNFDTKGKFSPVFWGRGNAWISIFIPEFLEICSAQLNRFEIDYLRNTLKYQIEALLPLQSKTGLWKTVLDDPTSYDETSATAGFLYGMIRAKELKIINGDKVDQAIAGATVGVLKEIDSVGHVRSVSSGTPVGQDRDFYNNIAITDMPYGQALSILALSQLA
ncbi:glycoside hydrolase family 88/105 protein [Lapidilactobacillus luobeiensis]|uniref:glycoside hydrolase family 88/105 protein n=1 Tax=Lapidilactobacillus luobeiensis TaxID=2950371 RepID=UPI0021C4894B|nr:glycoside hydrolase family 88 protein [Lapidilactobacillus luobeiensis]